METSKSTKVMKTILLVIASLVVFTGLASFFFSDSETVSEESTTQSTPAAPSGANPF